MAVFVVLFLLRCKLPFFVILPPFVPFSEYLGRHLAQTVDVPEITFSRGWTILEPERGRMRYTNTGINLTRPGGREIFFLMFAHFGFRGVFTPFCTLSRG